MIDPHALIQNFSVTELLLLGMNIVLLLASSWIDKALPPGPEADRNIASRLRIFRLLNLLPILLLLGFNLLLPTLESAWPLRIIAVLFVFYVTYLVFHISSWLIRRRFAKKREVGDEMHWVDTYNTRLLIVITAACCFAICLIATVRVLGMDSLLEAGGVIGFIGVMLALTQASWAPDIISGLIILNSRLLEEGDVIRFADEQTEQLGLVFKTKMFHTEFLDLTRNHRFILSNSKLRQLTLLNLSRFASARGLRESLSFKIGYGESPTRVRQVLADAFHNASAIPECDIDGQHEPEIAVSSTGDYAVTWTLYFYTKGIRSLVRTRQRLNEAVLSETSKHGIELATPILLASAVDSSADTAALAQ